MDDTRPRASEQENKIPIPRALMADISFNVMLISAYRVSLFLLCMILLMASVGDMLNEFSIVFVFVPQLLTLQTTEYTANNPAIVPGVVASVSCIFNACISTIFDVYAIAKIMKCHSLDETMTEPVICMDSPPNGSNYIGLGWLVTWVSMYIIVQTITFFTTVMMIVNRHQHANCRCFTRQYDARSSW